MAARYGYDEVRFFYQSIELIAADFDYDQVSAGLADPGIVYFLASIMSVFGVNVFTPFFHKLPDLNIFHNLFDTDVYSYQCRKQKTLGFLWCNVGAGTFVVCSHAG